MTLFSRWSSAWNNIVHRSRVERDLDDELRAALDLLVNERLRAGLSPEEARRRAVLEMGGIEVVKERVRDARSGRFADTLLQDLRYAARLLRRNPLFTASAALSVAIGIGANTTVFTVANALFFRRPAGVADPVRVVDIGVSSNNRHFNPGSYPDYIDIRQRATTLDGVYASRLFSAPMTLDAAGGRERIFASLVTENFFTVLGARPAAGRFFTDETAESPDGSAVSVLTHRFWTRQFGQDPGVVGRTVRLDGHAVTILGVAAERFQGTRLFSGDLWVPLGILRILRPQESLLTNRSAGWLLFGGRLGPHVSLGQASAELAAIASVLEREHPDQNRNKGFRVAESSMVPGAGLPIGIFLSLLIGLVSLVLLIACANLAGVLLARAVARRREIAVRLAMGAGRARLLRQLLTETMLLFAIGGAAGLLCARVMTGVVMSLLPAFPFPLELSLALDRRVIGFSLAVSLLAALVSGTAPAFQAAKTDVVSALKDERSGLWARTRLRGTFVVAQVAFSIVLVAAAGLFARALARAGSVNPGFDARGVDLVTFDFSSAGDSDAAGMLAAGHIVERVRAIPGVESAALARVAPGGFEGIGLPGVFVPGRTAAEPQQVFSWNVVEPGYFETLRIPILAGRDFAATDRGDTTPVIILSATAARQLWPDGNAVGRVVAQPAAPGSSAHVFSVVGVAGDIRSTSLLDGMANPFCYLPVQQHREFASRMTVLARAARGQIIVPAIRRAVGSLDARVTIVATQTLEESVALGLLPQRVATSLAGPLGFVSLLLAAVGIYGVTGYAVAQRTREIGVRVALGATSANVVAMVMRQGVVLAFAGSVIGLLMAAAANQLLASFLVGVTPLDVPVFAATSILAIIVGLAACYMPARRATRIHPVEALRCE